MRLQRIVLVAVIATSLFGAGCSLQAEPAGQTAEPQPVESESTAQEPEFSLLDPVIRRNFPDPDVIEHEGVYYAYATNHNLKNVQVATSTDLINWQVPNLDVLPNLPRWVIPNLTWAPEVSKWPDGTFRLYFTARNAAFPKQCLGVASASSPLGPFEVQGDSMLVCPEELGGAIDATVYFDNETPYLIWKNDGNCCGIPTSFYMSELSQDGLSIVAEPVILLGTSQDWEGILIEAPTLIKEGSTYYLFYSANDYGSENYAVGYATSDNLFGPYTKFDGPWLSTELFDGRIIGPGGQDIFKDKNGQWHALFHGWNISKSARYMYHRPLNFVEGRPELVLD